MRISIGADQEQRGSDQIRVRAGQGGDDESLHGDPMFGCEYLEPSVLLGRKVQSGAGPR